MATVSRAAFETLSRFLSKAYGKYVNDFGDNNLNPGALLELEAAMCRLREATLFHDDEYATIFPKFETTDPVGLGLQSARFYQPSVNALAFTSWTSQTWYPALEGPPCPEGWHVWYYNSWSAYTTSPQSGSEDGHYSTRKTYLYPVRYTGSGNYQRAPYWLAARYISLPNTTVGTLENGDNLIVFDVPLSEFAGYQIWDYAHGVPSDIRFYSFPQLVQNYNGTSWDPLTSSIPSPPDPNSIAQFINYDASISGNNVHFRLTIPTWLASGWTTGLYWHVIMYWGSADPNALSTDPAGAGHTPLAPELSVTPIIWSRKNFFRNELLDRVGWLNTGLNNAQYLVARNRTHYNFYDGQYSTPSVPSKYQLLTLNAAPILGIAGSLSGYVPSLNRGEYICVVMATKTNGTAYGTPSAQPEVFVGPKITPEFVPDDWSKCVYFPPIPVDYETLVKIVVTAAPGTATNIADGYPSDGGFFIPIYDRHYNSYEPARILCTLAIAWADQVVKTHAELPHGDGDWATSMLQAVRNSLLRLRLYHSSNPIITEAFSTMLPAMNIPKAFRRSVTNLADPTQNASKIFHGILKAPIDASMIPSDGPITFDDDGTKLINELTGLPPSTELMRINANLAELKNIRLPSVNTFEIYFDPSSQCHVMSTSTNGDRLGQDYTLRLLMETSDQNTLRKDWYINASSFYLTPEEYSRRIALGLTTTGYFYKSNLTNMPEFRLQGYAGVVPDLAMGDSRVLLTRVVSPPDSTRQTEAQFRQSLANQGYSQDEIDDAVQQFLDDGGEFLVVDLRQYDNKFLSVRNASVCVSKYNFFDIPYWTNNIGSLFGEYSTSDDGRIRVPPSALNYRADSFTVAESGLSVGDLERYGTQALYSSDAGVDYSDQTGFDLALSAKYTAFKIIPQSDNVSVSGFTFRIKCSLDSTTSTGLSNSPTEGLRLHVFSDSGDLPDQNLASGDVLKYNKLSRDVYEEARVALPYNFLHLTPYWIVIEKTTEPAGGRVVIDSGATTYTGLMSVLDPSPSNIWRPTSGRMWLRGYNTGAITTNPLFEAEDTTSMSYEYGEDEYVVYPSHAGLITFGGDTNRIALRLRAELSSDNTTTALQNSDLGLVNVVIYSDNAGAPSTTKLATSITSLKLNTIGTVFDNYVIDLSATLSAGSYWVVVSLSQRPLGGWLGLCKQARPITFMANSGTESGAYVIQSNKPWIRSYLASPTMLAAFNRDTANVTESLPGPNIQRTYIGVSSVSPTYKVEGYWAYNFTRFSEPKHLTLYPRAAFDSVSREWVYVQFSKACYVILRLYRGSHIIDKYITIPAAPGWNASFWQRNDTNFKTFDATPALVSTTFDTINLDQYYADGSLQPYYNTRFEGYFTPKYSESYTLTVTSSGGCRVYLDDVVQIDTWDAPTDNPSPVVIGLLSNLTTYHIVVEYYSAGEADEFLTVKWQSSTQNLDFIGPTSALVPANTEIPISDTGGDLYDGIAYMAIGKQLSDIQDITNGAPPGDNLVIRSS